MTAFYYGVMMNSCATSDPLWIDVAMACAAISSCCAALYAVWQCWRSRNDE